MRPDQTTAVNGDTCPVPLATLGALYKAEDVDSIVAGIPEGTRARLAAYLYGRSHTHELGMKVAATCAADALEDAAGPLGGVIYTLSRQPYARPSYGENRPLSKAKISLGGSRAAR